MPWSECVLLTLFGSCWSFVLLFLGEEPQQSSLLRLDKRLR